MPSGDYRVGETKEQFQGRTSEFWTLAIKSPTDKITSHSYQSLYGKYLPEKLHTPGLADEPILEIGLSCTPYNYEDFLLISAGDSEKSTISICRENGRNSYNSPAFFAATRTCKL